MYENSTEEVGKGTDLNGKSVSERCEQHWVYQW